VQAFMDGELPFIGIPEVIERALEKMPPTPIGHFSQIAAIDHEARVKARELIANVPV
jgi:1-deoxy-D-xylulose 5-phosphate reductoisomerase